MLSTGLGTTRIENKGIIGGGKDDWKEFQRRQQGVEIGAEEESARKTNSGTDRDASVGKGANTGS